MINTKYLIIGYKNCTTVIQGCLPFQSKCFTTQLCAALKPQAQKVDVLRNTHMSRSKIRNFHCLSSAKPLHSHFKIEPPSHAGNNISGTANLAAVLPISAQRNNLFRLSCCCSFGRTKKPEPRLCFFKKTRIVRLLLRQSLWLFVVN